MQNGGGGSYYGPNQMRDDLLVLQRKVADVVVARNTGERVGLLLDTVRKLAGNIVEAPGVDKFRRVKKANALIAERVLAVEGGEQWLLVLGWEEDPDGHSYVFPRDADLDAMVQGLRVLEMKLPPGHHAAAQPPGAPAAPLVAQLAQLANIPEAYARRLLEAHGMQLDRAVEAYFNDVAAGGGESGVSGGGSVGAPTTPPPANHSADTAAGTTRSPAPPPTPPSHGAPPAVRRRSGLDDPPPTPPVAPPQGVPGSSVPAAAPPTAVRPAAQGATGPADIAGECSRLVSVIERNKATRDRARPDHPDSVESQHNAVLEPLLALAPQPPSAKLLASVPERVETLLQLREGMASDEARAVASMNVVALLAMNQTAGAARVPQEMKVVQQLLGELEAEQEVRDMVAGYVRAVAPPKEGGGDVLPLPRYVHLYNTAARRVAGNPIEGLVGFAGALRLAKEEAWAHGAYYALSGIAAGNLAVNNVSGAENAVHQRGQLPTPRTAAAPWSARLASLSRYGAFTAVAHPLALPGDHATTAAGHAAAGLRHSQGTPGGAGNLPLLTCLVLFKFSD